MGLIFFMTAVTSRYQLLKADEMKINRERWNSAQLNTNFSFYVKIPVGFFLYPLSPAVNIFELLVTADYSWLTMNEIQPKGVKFGIPITFRVHMKIPVEIFLYQL